MTAAFDTCVLCPRLCRDACPVATGTAREAAVPTWIATALREHAAGQLSREDAAAAATLCTDCGGCQHHCHLDRPLPALLRTARAALLDEPGMEPLGPIAGIGEWVAVEGDRPYAAALAALLGAPVRSLRTNDGLGVAAVEHPGFDERARQLRARFATLHPVVCDGGSAIALSRAGVSFRWLHSFLPVLPVGVTHSCVMGREGAAARGMVCCGAAGPLARYHPAEADRVARAFGRRVEPTRVLDVRCATHLRHAGVPVEDVLDLLEVP